VQKLFTYLAIFVLLTVMTNSVMAQPGGGGGLQVMKIYDADGVMISKSDTGLRIRQYILSGKNNRVKREIMPDGMNSRFNYANKVYTHIFLPPYILQKNQRKAAPNQRVQLLYNNDTMTIDFIGIIGENPAGNTDHMERINFKPGYFKSYRNPHQSHSRFWNDTALTLKQKNEIFNLLYQGLDDVAVYQLQNLGLLEYIPPVPSKIIRPRPSKRIRCSDTVIYNGYNVLCHVNIVMKEGNIEITSSAKPIIIDSVGQCYKFYYYFPFNPFSRDVSENEQKDGHTFLREIRTAQLTINKQLFSGCVRISTTSYLMRAGNTNHSVYSILVLYYQNGKVVREENLHDVDPKTEQPIERLS
jgi:hypothetical protein